MLRISDELTGSILCACFREQQPERSKWKGRGRGVWGVCVCVCVCVCVWVIGRGGGERHFSMISVGRVKRVGMSITMSTIAATVP